MMDLCLSVAGKKPVSVNLLALSLLHSVVYYLQGDAKSGKTFYFYSLYYTPYVAHVCKTNVAYC